MGLDNRIQKMDRCEEIVTGALLDWGSECAGAGGSGLA